MSTETLTARAVDMVTCGGLLGYAFWPHTAQGIAALVASVCAAGYYIHKFFVDHPDHDDES